jgi:hypothetical protein
MRFPGPPAFILALLILAVSAPLSIYLLALPKQSQPKRPQRVDVLDAAINELLGRDPLAPGQMGKTVSSATPSDVKDNPPADDAPIKNLIDYWSLFSNFGKQRSREPSDKVRERLLEAVDGRPELVSGLFHTLPKNTDTFDILYKLTQEEMEKEGPPSLSKGFTQFWLMHESPYFRDELIEAARSFDEDNPGSETSLRAMARLDYETAKPILEAFASAGKPLQKSIAWSLLYGRAQQDGDSAQIEKYGTLLPGG